MTITSVLQAIENIKLQLPSTDYVDIQVKDLETLYNNTKRLERLVANQENSIALLSSKLNILNELAQYKLKPKLNHYA